MLPIAILIPRHYWTRPAVPGNHSSHRALPDILQALRQAGARGRLVETGARARLEDYAALILPGGGDIHPQFYGQAPHGDPRALDPAYDEFQLSWTREALQRKLPVLGICRGMQVLNVAAGGTLHQDVPGHLFAERRGEAIHPISLAPGRLQSILGAPSLGVNSIHHQALDRLGDGVRPVAWAPDGVVEAIEFGPSQRGVQFHPEDLRAQRPFRALFEALVQDCLKAA